MKKQEPTWAQLIGGGMAHFQHAIDTVFSWGFRKLRSAGEAKEARGAAQRHPVLRGTERAGRGVLAFLGQIGDSFFERYAELKSRRR